MPSPFASRITLRHLRVVQALGRELSLSRAAAALNTSQPAISAALRELEGLLDARLFERTTRRVSLTPLGRALLRQAERVLAELEHAERDFEAARAGAGGEVHVGQIAAVPAGLLAGALARLQARGDRVRVTVHEGSAQVLVQELAHGRLDLLLSHLSMGVTEAQLDVEVLYEEATCLVVGLAHPLARRRRLDWRDLQPLQWILPPPDVPARSRIEREMLTRGMPDLSMLIEAGSPTTVLALLQAVPAVATMPRHVAAPYARQGLLKVLPMAFEVVRGPFAVLRRRAVPATPMVARLRDALREQARVLEG